MKRVLFRVTILRDVFYAMLSGIAVSGRRLRRELLDASISIAHRTLQRALVALQLAGVVSRTRQGWVRSAACPAFSAADHNRAQLLLAAQQCWPA